MKRPDINIRIHIVNRWSSYRGSIRWDEPSHLDVSGEDIMALNRSWGFSIRFGPLAVSAGISLDLDTPVKYEEE